MQSTQSSTLKQGGESGGSKTDEQRELERLRSINTELLEALSNIHKLYLCPAPKTMRDWFARCDVMADYARKAIAKKRLLLGLLRLLGVQWEDIQP